MNTPGSPAPAHPYQALDPALVLDAVAAAGFEPDGRLLALASYENRVYQVGIDGASPLVAKFYRPGRWPDAAIAEEHDFAAELAAAELPMIAPIRVAGQSLLRHAGFRYALYPRRGGRAPELESRDNLEWMGRLLARLHGIGARQRFASRPTLDAEGFIRRPAQCVLAGRLLPAPSRERYAERTRTLAEYVEARFRAVAPQILRLHGDCHPGNVLWTDAGPHFVDLDDARNGPAIQDLWMLAPTPEALDALLEGYATFADFDPAERALIGPLRIMRQVHWAGWVAERWDDPAFPRAFPQVGEAPWWEQHVEDLGEALARAADA